MDEKTFFQKEMERIERQQKNLHDQYNQENREFNLDEYVRRLRQGSMLKFGLASGEKISNYYERLRIHVDNAAEKNTKTHVWNNGRGCWFTHTDKFGVGCFMCEDLNLIHYLTSIVGYFAKKYPDETINF